MFNFLKLLTVLALVSQGYGEEPSGAPLDIISEPKGPKTIRISWRAPHRETWNGDLTGFYVGYKLSSDVSKPFSLRTVAVRNVNYTHEYLLQGLDKATEYTMMVKAHNSDGSGPASREVTAKTLSGELPPAPKLFLITITSESASLMWRMVKSAYSSSKISGFSIYYKPEYQFSWKEISVPAAMGREDGDHLLKGLEADTLYYIYVTAINNYGHGDPSTLLTIKTRQLNQETFSGSMFNTADINLMAFQKDLISFVSITIAVVLVIIVIIISLVCIKKAQLDAANPLRNLCAPPPRLVETDKSGVYIGTTHRYVDFDQRPLMQGNLTGHLIDAQGNIYPPYATLAPGTSVQLGMQQEEMKSFMGTPKPWQRPLPIPDGASSSQTAQRKIEPQENVYDYVGQ
ncbi:Down syndrome cell adhesion molecule-like protein 1 -like protein [Halotydeus destructor]|nr:Down syndrome cell adhesion molecule-like protein 1 -like protein [Halotydeus destructor]